MNIVHKIFEHRPSDKKVLIDAKNDSSLTMEQLQLVINNLSFELSKEIKPNDKVLLFVKPSLLFAPLVFSLFAVGATPILIDPGMGLKSLLKSIKQVKPDYLIAEKEVHLIKFFSRSNFVSIKKSFYPTSFGSITRLLSKKRDDKFGIYEKSPDELACILFTSGGTGIPKGVEYTHKIFSTQTKTLQDVFKLTNDDIDYPGFPLFALFTLSMGMTSIIPPMNPSKPALANPQKLYDGIKKYSPTFVAGSPAIWERLFDYCLKNNLTLPSIKYLVMFGAPVALSLHNDAKKILPNGNTYTPYGATESLPIANVTGDEVLKKMSIDVYQTGIFLGKPLENIELKIVSNQDANYIECKQNEIGEIVVSGDIVTKQYYDLPEETQKAKIIFQNKTWHKIGDVGHLDNEGGLWFCGRTAHQIKTSNSRLYSIPTELAFRQLPDIKKCALVNFNNAPALCILPKDPKKIDLKLIRLIATQHEQAKEIERFFICKKFPVDVRHNIKIDRLELGSNLKRYLL